MRCGRFYYFFDDFFKYYVFVIKLFGFVEEDKELWVVSVGVVVSYGYVFSGFVI